MENVTTWRELTSDQIDLLTEKGCDGTMEDEFMVAGTNPKMYEDMPLGDIMDLAMSHK